MKYANSKNTGGKTASLSVRNAPFFSKGGSHQHNSFFFNTANANLNVAKENKIQRQMDSSFPEEEKHKVQTKVENSIVGGKALQMRGGEKVGELCVRSNAVNDGLTAGHAWLSYTPVDGSETTYGTWGNRSPIGLHRDLEVGFNYKASRCTDLDAEDLSSLESFADSNNSWSMTNNCASFAGRGWATVTGEPVNYSNLIGIANPSSLGAGIQALGSRLDPDAANGTENEEDSSSSWF